MTARRTTFCCVALLTLAIVMTFGPVVRNNFTDWDDPDTIWANPHLHPATFSNIGWYWNHSDAELYIPVTYTAWGGLAHLGQKPAPNGTMGPDPAVFHAASIA